MGWTRDQDTIFLQRRDYQIFFEHQYRHEAATSQKEREREKGREKERERKREMQVASECCHLAKGELHAYCVLCRKEAVQKLRLFVETGNGQPTSFLLATMWRCAQKIRENFVFNDVVTCRLDSTTFG